MIGLRVAGALLALSSSLLSAQEASVFVGGARARYGDSASGTAGFVAARLGSASGPQAGQLDASVARFIDGGWALQVGAQGTAVWRTGSGATVAGVAAGAALSDFQNGRASGTAAVGPLAAFPLGASSLVVGAAAGVARTVDGVWNALGSASLRWQWTPAASVAFDAGVTGTAADTLRLADVSLALRVQAGAVRGAASAGLRVGSLDGPWGAAELVWEPVPRLAFEVAAGRYPRDLTGFADGLYAQAGLRLYPLRGPPAARRASPARRAPVTAHPRGDGRVEIRVRYAQPVRSLAIAGDWNAWTPVPLVPDGANHWSIALPLAPGAYKYALVADGEWTVPDGAATVPDDFGGQVGVLMVGGEDPAPLPDAAPSQ